MQEEKHAGGQTCRRTDMQEDKHAGGQPNRRTVGQEECQICGLLTLWFLRPVQIPDLEDCRLFMGQSGGKVMIMWVVMEGIPAACY